MSNKRKYTKSEKIKEYHKKLEKHITGINEQYWNEFEKDSGKSEGSLIQYKSAVRRFVEYINKDVLESTITDLESYLLTCKEGKTKSNQKRYIESFIRFTIVNNFDRAVKETSSDLILHLVPEEYKGLLRVLLNK